MKLTEKIYIQELREQFLQKIIDDWQNNWQKDFNEFESFETIKNKNAFLESLLADIEVCLFKKLNGHSHKFIFSKDFLRRFIYEYGIREARIQSHSRNGISIYLGYESWEDFVSRNQLDDSKNISINYLNIDESFLPILLKNQSILMDNQNFIDFKEVKPKRNLKKYLLGLLTLTLVFAGIGVGIGWWNNRPFDEENLKKVRFEVIKTVGKYPQAIRIKYDVSALPNVQNIEVETGVGKVLTFSKFEGFTVVSDKKIDTVEQTYFYPGIYKLSLMVNKKIVKNLYHIVYSEPDLWTVWGFGVAYGKNWITNINSTTKYIKNGIFHFDPKELPNEIRDENDLKNTAHVLVQDFGVSLDSTEIEARLKNPLSEGGESCYDMDISFFDKNFNAIGAKFTTEGCTDFANLMAGKTYFRIQNNKQKNIDLDSFGVNEDEWNVFKITIKGKTLEVFVNNKSAFKGKFETFETISDLVDTRISFKGAGSIDWVKIRNSFTQKTIYNYDF